MIAKRRARDAVAYAGGVTFTGRGAVDEVGQCIKDAATFTEPQLAEARRTLAELTATLARLKRQHRDQPWWQATRAQADRLQRALEVRARELGLTP